MAAGRRLVIISTSVLLFSAVGLIGQNTPASVTHQNTGAAGKAAAAEEAGDAKSLAKATQNPVASLISVPIQDNANFGVGRMIECRT